MKSWVLSYSSVSSGPIVLLPRLLIGETEPVFWYKPESQRNIKEYKQIFRETVKETEWLAHTYTLIDESRWREIETGLGAGRYDCSFRLVYSVVSVKYFEDLIKDHLTDVSDLSFKSHRVLTHLTTTMVSIWLVGIKITDIQLQELSINKSTNKTI